MGKFVTLTYGQWARGLGVLVAALLVGHEMDKNELDRVSRLRDRSALFGPDYKAGNPPSWGRPEYKPMV